MQKNLFPVVPCHSQETLRFLLGIIPKGMIKVGEDEIVGKRRIYGNV